VDVHFTSNNTGVMDKVIFDTTNQIIYYKNGSFSKNNPFGTIGKIYCPSNMAQANSALSTPPNNPVNDNYGIDSGVDSDQGSSNIGVSPSSLTFFFNYSSTTSLSGVGCNPGALTQGTTCATLDVSSGALNLFPADGNDNNDMCLIGNTDSFNFTQDNKSELAVTCSGLENSVMFSSLSVRPFRQNTVTILNDILFEDLTGSGSQIYSLSATFGNLINQGGGKNINLGTNPDLVGDESVANIEAPSGVEAGLLYCSIDPSTGNIEGIKPNNADGGSFSVGSRSTITNNITAAELYFSNSPVRPGRYDMDNVDYICRIPAYPSSGTYSQEIIITIAAS
jgi:hypothetical protein